jgi:general secretion pathway protein D
MSTRTAEDAIKLELKPEMTFVSNGSTTQRKLTVCKLHEQITLKPGQTVLVAFPPTQRLSVLTESVPYLGDIPLVGRLFREQWETSYRSDLLLVATVGP